MLVTVLAGTKCSHTSIKYIGAILETSIHKKHPNKGTLF